MSLFCSHPVELHFLNFFLQPAEPTQSDHQGDTTKNSKICDFEEEKWPKIPHVKLKQVNEEFAQKFVDLLCLHPTYMKPCVSFGQDNDLVYCTVPATSTQGAISAEDKAKQARGGVQLVRFKTPPLLTLTFTL